MRLHDYLHYWARINPENAFATVGDRSLTYAEAEASAYQVAQALTAAVEQGDRVAFLSKNSLEYAVMYFGAAIAGVVPVPMNYRLAPPEWEYIINDCGARVVIASAEFAEALAGVRGELSGVERFLVIGGAVDGWESYEDLVASQPAEPVDRTVTDDDDLYQMYTSGTTGRPKGAIIAHRALTSNVMQAFPVLRFDPGDRSLIVAPMYHAAAGIQVFSSIAQGAELLIHEDFNPVEVVRALDEENISASVLVPAMIQACLVLVPDVAERKYEDLKTIAYGASPIAEDTLRKAVAAFKCDFAQAFGMTETVAVLTWLSPADHRRALGGDTYLLLAAGRPALGTELRIVDEDGNDLPNGEVGEVLARGPQLMRGYWNMPDESAEALRGGWMHTGDAGKLDDEGYLFIMDRVKDMIVSGGENVYPRAVEDALFQHPAVADVAVIGIPDEQWGETVKAIVVLRDGESATDEELMEFCDGRLGGFQRPRSVDFIAELPRNASGKVLKRELREPFWVGHARRVAGV